jgi:serine phosphatase RsbU (regulator of sigma subunit)
LVVGDVSGKGLRAAMMTSVLVGALLNRRSSEPAAVLEELNRAIAGQLDNGFVTCCAALFDSTGGVTIASAGHLAPYCRGVELDLPAGLPLGVVEGARYESTHIRLASNDRLMFLTDGVLEAADPHGELFGFDRARAVCGAAASEIANAATAWGQNDDITVVAVQRAA